MRHVGNMLHLSRLLTMQREGEAAGIFVTITATHPIRHAAITTRPCWCARICISSIAAAAAPRSRPARDVDMGPIMNQEHAERKAREYIADHPDQEWTGHWKTTSRGVASLINVRGSRPTRDVDVGPIRNQEHAERKAREYIVEHRDQEWTGHWKTTSRGTSVTGVRDNA
ncbi:unnamed protein product [Pylaiella littoralis]